MFENKLKKNRGGGDNIPRFNFSFRAALILVHLKQKQKQKPFLHLRLLFNLEE